MEKTVIIDAEVLSAWNVLCKSLKAYMAGKMSSSVAYMSIPDSEQKFVTRDDLTKSQIEKAFMSTMALGSNRYITEHPDANVQAAIQELVQILQDMHKKAGFRSVLIIAEESKSIRLKDGTALNMHDSGKNNSELMTSAKTYVKR